MKTFIFCICALAFSVQVHAKPAAAKGKSAAAKRAPAAALPVKPFYVHLLDMNTDAKAAAQAMPGTIVFTPVTAEKVARRVVLPLRDQAELFQKSGLAPFVTSFDQFDKDMLVRYLRTYDAAFVRKKYKKVPLETLQAAKTMLAATPVEM